MHVFDTHSCCAALAKRGLYLCGRGSAPHVLWGDLPPETEIIWVGDVSAHRYEYAVPLVLAFAVESTLR